jgi:CDP-diacylglycerol--glycerol-3-phosphate 3-phosphatidyltransferase
MNIASPPLPNNLGDVLYLAGFIAFFTVPFLVYLGLLWTGRIELPPAKAKGAGRRLLGPIFVGYYYWLMAPLFRLAIRSPFTPNQVTGAALVAATLSAIAIATGHFALASALVIGGCSLDIVDGQLARAKKASSPAGAFFDSTLDRLCDGVIFSGCVVYYAGSPMMVVSLVVLVMSFTVSYARSRAEALGIVGAEGLMQRADRIVILGIALAFSPFFAHRSEGFVAHPFYGVTAGALCLLAVLNASTALARIVWTMDRLKEAAAPSAIRSREAISQMVAPAPANDARLLAQGTLQSGR